MADSKITALTSISTSSDPANDPLVIVDVSDTSMAATGTTKKVTLNQLLATSPTATLASATITGDLTASSDVLVNGNEKYVYLSSNYSIGNNSRVRFRAVGAGGGSGYGGDFRISTRASNNTWNTDVLTIDSSANCIWTDGAGGTRMTLNSTGLGVGGSPSRKLSVSGAGGGFDVTDTTQSTRIRMRSSSASNFYIEALNSAESAYVTLRLNDTTQIDTSGNVGIGVTPSAGKGCLQLSSGINFPATQVASSDANTLDDYEESTWSPTVGASTGTPTTVTVNSATYTKVGRLVVCSFDFSIVNIGTASSSLQFTLPFTSITSTAFCGSFRETSSTGNMGQVFYESATNASCLLYNNATPWVNGYRIRGTYTYFAA